jgi:DNA modification methylase
MHTNKVHHVTTISRVAEDFGENEDWLFDVAMEMEIEDGVIWLYGVGEDGVMAFTDFGNLWTYPGASTLGSDARRGLQDHPTVKPTAMLEDALLDLTHRGDIVLHPFLGSGSTLIAAEATGRVCRGVELDPLYVEGIIRRYQAATGQGALLVETGETFEALAARRTVPATGA